MRVPRVICDARSMSGETATFAYDLTVPFKTTINRGFRIDAGTFTVPTHFTPEHTFFTRGWSLWLHPQDGVKSNFDIIAGNLPAEGHQGMRNHFRDVFRIGNQFEVATGSWFLSGDNAGNQVVHLFDVVLASSFTGAPRCTSSR